MVATARKSRVVSPMVKYLERPESLLNLEKGPCTTNIVAVDGRTALQSLAKATLTSRQRAEHYWTLGVKEAVPEVRPSGWQGGSWQSGCGSRASRQVP